MSTTPSLAVIAGATGQDGHLLAERLLNERWTVRAEARLPEPDLRACHGDYVLGTRVDSQLLRLTNHPATYVGSSRIEKESCRSPRVGVDAILQDMLVQGKAPHLAREPS
jgi:hypothetical protein